MRLRKLGLMALAMIFCLVGTAQAAPTIKLGFPIPLTGEIPKVGESTKFAAEMLKEEINSKGGLEVGGKKYMLEFIYEDNESKPDSAVNVALKLIERDQVLALIGPQSSRPAVSYTHLRRRRCLYTRPTTRSVN